MKFIIEQIAIAPRYPELARQLLEDMEAVDWTQDHVKAKGTVHGFNAENEADLSFNYELANPVGTMEFEILDYRKGNSWLTYRGPESIVSHFGMHCTSEQLDKWRLFFEKRKIRVAQEVETTSHTNPAIAGKRRYKYVIFDTRDILGTDLKLIVRIE